MSFTAGDADLLTLDLLLPWRGLWVAEATCTQDATFGEGDTVDMSVGSLELRGTVIRGSNNGDSASYFLVGGNGGWRETVERRFYRDDNGIKLSQVLRDLANEAGESLELKDSVSSVIVGDAWTRAESPAIDCLQKLGQFYRMRPDGVMVVGPAEAVASDKLLSVKSFDAAKGKAIIEFPEDGQEGLLPGMTVNSDGFEFTVHDVRFLVRDGSVLARVST